MRPKHIWSCIFWPLHFWSRYACPGLPHDHVPTILRNISMARTPITRAPATGAPLAGAPMAGNHKWKFKQKITPLWYASIDSNPHPLESLGRDDSELETRYGLRAKTLYEKFEFVWKIQSICEDSGSSPIAGSIINYYLTQEFFLQPQWNPYPTLPSFLLSLAYCSIMALSRFAAFWQWGQSVNSSQGMIATHVWLVWPFTHTHTHFTHQMAPGSRNHSHWEIHQSATYLLLQTILPTHTLHTRWPPDIFPNYHSQWEFIWGAICPLHRQNSSTAERESPIMTAMTNVSNLALPTSSTSSTIKILVSPRPCWCN